MIATTMAVEGEEARAPRADYLLFTLTAACLLSFVDRFTLNVLLGPIKSSMQLSDTQISLLVGFAFSAFYSVMAMPFGWAVDRWNRRNLILAGLLLWSVATAASGLATSFGQLLTARIFVGVGEATLMPAAYSMLADAFPARQRGRAFGVFSIAVYAGGGVALLLGGALLALASELVKTIPVVAQFEPWHLVFLVIGSVGVPMAALMLATPEPTRRHMPQTGMQGTSLLRYVWNHRAPFSWVLLVYTLYTYVTYGVLPWAPTLMVRKFGLEPSEAGLTIGCVTLIGGIIGASAGGVLSDRWIRRNVAGGRLRATLIWWIGALIAIPCFTIAPTVLGAALGYLGFILFNSLAYVSMSAVFQDMVPPALRGRITSFWYVVTYIGAGVGPLVTGLLTDRWFVSPAALPQAIMWMSVPIVLIGFLCSLRALPLYDAMRARTAGAL